MNKIISMSALVLIDKQTNKLLFQKRPKKAKWNPNVWGFFGGKAELNETPNQTLIREIKEEINFNLENKNFKFIEKYFYENTNCHFYYYFISESEKKELELLEGQGWTWEIFENALKLDFGTVKGWQLNFLNTKVKEIITK